MWYMEDRSPPTKSKMYHHVGGAIPSKLLIYDNNPISSVFAI